MRPRKNPPGTPRRKAVWEPPPPPGQYEVMVAIGVRIGTIAVEYPDEVATALERRGWLPDLTRGEVRTAGPLPWLTKPTPDAPTVQAWLVKFHAAQSPSGGRAGRRPRIPRQPTLVLALVPATP